MITPAQKKWIDHLSDTDTIKIIPFDPTSEEKFQKVKEIVHSALGAATPFEHRGATSFKISGQDEIDTYIPVDRSKFDEYAQKLKGIFGEPTSVYPDDRFHFVTRIDGKRVDVYLINRDSLSWKNGDNFHKYLLKHPEALEKYRVLKEEGHGLSVREYYRRKTEFINEVLSLHEAGI